MDTHSLVWRCPGCTLDNSLARARCLACDFYRPHDTAAATATAAPRRAAHGTPPHARPARAARHAAAAPRPAPRVAAQWQELVDPSTGATYYHNPVTKETTWEAPPGHGAPTPPPPPPPPPAAPPAPATPVGWEAAPDAATGLTYYHNTVTGEVQWEVPRAAPAPPARAVAPAPAPAPAVDYSGERRRFGNRLLHALYCEVGSIQGSRVPAAFELHTGLVWREAVEAAGYPPKKTLATIAADMPDNVALVRDGGAGVLTAVRVRRACTKDATGECTWWGLACDLQHRVGAASRAPTGRLGRRARPRPAQPRHAPHAGAPPARPHHTPRAAAGRWPRAGGGGGGGGGGAGAATPPPHVATGASATTRVAAEAAELASLLAAMGV